MARILLVDDDPMYRELVQEMLERRGHDVVTAENGRQGLNRLAQEDVGAEHPVDLVITDLFMPQMDGAQFIMAIREQRQEPIPLIGMTGGYSDAVRPYTQSLLKLGSDAVLSKPFSESELSATIERVLGGSP